MKILLDQCVPQPLRTMLPGHDVVSSGFMGWDGLRNGLLLKTAAAAGFDVLLTTDKQMPYQQNLATLPIAILLVSSLGTRLQDIRPVLPQVLEALEKLQPRTLVEVHP